MRIGSRHGAAHRWAPSSARSTPHLRSAARRSARPDSPVRSEPRYGGRHRTPRTPRHRQPRHSRRQKPCRPTVQWWPVVVPSRRWAVPAASSCSRRIGGVSMIHWSRGTPGSCRYGWKPKHSGTALVSGRSHRGAHRQGPARKAGPSAPADAETESWPASPDRRRSPASAVSSFADSAVTRQRG